MMIRGDFTHTAQRRRRAWKRRSKGVGSTVGSRTSAYLKGCSRSAVLYPPFYPPFENRIDLGCAWGPPSKSEWVGVSPLPNMH